MKHVGFEQWVASLDLVAFFERSINVWHEHLKECEICREQGLEFSEASQDTFLEFVEYAEPHEIAMVCIAFVNLKERFDKLLAAQEAAKQEFGFDEETAEMIQQAVNEFLLSLGLKAE
jgi:hypothetical protein